MADSAAVEAVPDSAPEAASHKSAEDELQEEAVAALLDPAQPADLAYWNYPAALKPLGLNVIVVDELTVERDGKVSDATVVRSSALKEFDEAALTVGRLLRFRPAEREDEQPRRTIRFKLGFHPWFNHPGRVLNEKEVERIKKQLVADTPGAANMNGLATLAVVVDRSGSVVRAMVTHSSGEWTLDSLAVLLAKARRYELPPDGSDVYHTSERIHEQFGKVDERHPKLANRKQITKLLKKHFRDPNRCGVTLLWVYVAEGGWTQSMQIQTSSGHEELDTLARALAWQMKWKPATAAGQPVSAWVELPIQYNNDGRCKDRD